MCRHAAYLGPPIPLRRFLLEPPHSLVVQAWKPREQITAVVNADGFGIGWYQDDGSPGVYLNPLPIWADGNLVHLGRGLSSRLWLGNVRSATPGLGFGAANTHPFLADRLLFSHNGLVEDFASVLRAPLRAELPPDIDAGLGGNTDSEHLFALLRALHRETGDLVAALHALWARLRDWLDDARRPALLNLLISDGGHIYATRSAFARSCPSLYYCVDDSAFADGQLVASEPMTTTGEWQPVPDHYLVILAPGLAPRLEPL